MPEINLLPIDLSQKSETSLAANSVKKIILVLSSIFLVLIVLGIILIVFLTNQVNASTLRATNLKAEIQKLETVEQKLILVKDRIAKIKEAQGEINTETSLETLNPIMSNLPANVTLDSISIENDGAIEFAVISRDSLGMATYMNSLVSSGIYKELSLSDFVFAPETGYKITLTNP